MTTIGGHEVVPLTSPVPRDKPMAHSLNAPRDFPRPLERCVPTDSVGHRTARGRRQTNARQEQALHELFANSRQQLVRVAHRILRNHEDAEDAVQNAFLSACRHFNDFQGRCALKTWLTRIVMNAALMVRRKQRNPFISPLPDLADAALFVETIQDLQPNPEQICSRAESFAFLNRLIAEMNPLFRSAIEVAYYDELSSREASSALAIPITTYKARLFRGTYLLKDTARKRQHRFSTRANCCSQSS
jgi:RNA polymerase sigma-70 factor, ECF subfamily